ncbi:MAG: helix-turn-helix transcriptional regulator [Weeksellaceae bacterium]|nr:helix-turn-helix transcriptional regulator [Weeksellaceae bacterium]
MVSFGHYIKLEREKRNWTQTEFGAKIGINSSAISRIENGTQKFSKSKLPKLSEIFQIDLQKIIDLFYADKFALEAYENHCSDNVFVVAEDNIKYIKSNYTKQAKLNF